MAAHRLVAAAGLLFTLCVALVTLFSQENRGHGGGARAELAAVAAKMAAVHAAAVSKKGAALGAAVARKGAVLGKLAGAPGESGMVAGTDKDLAAAAAVKGEAGDDSPEGEALKTDGTAPDNEDDIKKIQEEVAAAADDEIKSAKDQAQTAAEEAYSKSRDLFMSKEAEKSGPPTDDIFPAEGTPGRPAGYARAPAGAHGVVAPRAAVKAPSPVGVEKETKAPGVAIKEQRLAMVGSEKKSVSPSSSSPAKPSAAAGKAGLAVAAAATSAAAAAAEGRKESLAMVGGPKVDHLSSARGRGESVGGGGGAGLDYLYREAMRDLVSKVTSSVVASPTTTRPASSSPPPSSSSYYHHSKGWNPSQRWWDEGDRTAEVPTDCGNVRGVTFSGVDSFKGIPYALPTARWAPSKPLSSSVKGVPLAGCWSGVLDATEFGPICPQAGGSRGGAWAGEAVDEASCLSLNVYAPSKAGGKGGESEEGDLLPVVVFVHGGGNVEGAGSRYDLSSLAARGFVAVSLNYRLGALGFFAHPSFGDAANGGGAGNFGLGDVGNALGWVERNIEAFGGDPSRVALVGQGSGATNALALTVSRLGRKDGEKDGDMLFSRVIAMSGPPSFGSSLDKASRRVEGYASSACPSVAVEQGKLGDKAMSCLRAIPAQEVMVALTGAAAEDYDLPSKGDEAESLLVQDGDTIEKGSWRAFGDVRLQGKVSIMMTYMAEEGLGCSTKWRSEPASWHEYRSEVTKSLSGFGYFWDAGRGDVPIAREALKLYQGARFGITPARALARMVTDARFLCPAKRIAGLAASIGAPSLVYLGVNNLSLKDGSAAITRLSSDGLSYVSSRDSLWWREEEGGSFTGLDMLMYLRDESRYSFQGEDAASADLVSEIFDQFVRTGATEGAGYGTIQDLKAYAWKPVSDGAKWGGEDALGYPNGVAVGTIAPGGVSMVDGYHKDECGLFSRDAIDRQYAAAA